MSGMLPPPPLPMPPPPLGPAAPPMLPPIPNLVPPGMRPTGLQLGSEQMLAYLLKRQQPDEPADSDDDLPSGLRPYAAGLRPAIRPTGAAWQQEIIYERLGKEDGEIEDVARFYLQQAQNYDQELRTERIEANNFYAGGKIGGEEPGRSHLVLTVVRDTIRATLPSLLRVFTAVDDPISFEPVASEYAGDDKLATMLARQATDYCRWAIFTANRGWQVLHDTLLDALTRKAGWIRWSWGARRANRTEVCNNLLLPQLQLLLSEPGIAAQRIVRRPMTQPEVQAVQRTPEGQMYLSQGGPPEYWAATITRTAANAWPIIEAVPAESVWVDPDATTLETARAVFHVRDRVPASDLIEMGLPADKVIAHGGAATDAGRRSEVISRNGPQGRNYGSGPPPSDRSMKECRYIEGWIRCDADNDDVAELLHVHMLGSGATLIQWDRVDEVPLACFTPYREPGRIVGLSQADMVMDLQKTESRVMRAVLDSLAQSIFPRTVAVLGQVNMQDARQTSMGAMVRVSQQGALQELTKPFMGKEALPVMQVLEAVRESRTGITRASQGLTVDELQSTAPIAVSQQTSAAQDRLDMMARTLAETGLAPLYKGLLKMLARQQDRPNMIRIRGEWVPIDPRVLATQWQASVNVGGKGMPMERLAMLAQIAGKQEMIIQQTGMDNPLVGIPEYRNTLARMLETANIADVSSYFKALPPGWQPPPPNNQPTDSQLLAMAQQQKNAADLETDRGKAQTDRARMLTEDDLKRAQAALDACTKTWVAGAQFGTPGPSLTEFQQAMQSKAPQIGLLPSVPTPTSPQQPATNAPAGPPQPPGGPQRPPGPALAAQP